MVRLACCPDGSVYILGARVLNGSLGTFDRAAVLAHFTADGSLDSNFGGAGTGFVTFDSE